MLTSVPTDTEKEQAREFAKAYEDPRFGKNKLGVSREEYLRFIYIGKLCEIVFIRELRDRGIEVNCPNLLVPSEGDSRSGPDFDLPSSGQTVDIKAAIRDFHGRLVVREDQLQACVYDVYVGAKCVNDTKIEFRGYTMGENLMMTPVGDLGTAPCRSVPFANLVPIEKFLEYAEKGETVRQG